MHGEQHEPTGSSTFGAANGMLDFSDILSKYAGSHQVRYAPPDASPVSTMDPSGFHEGFAERLSGRSSSFSVEASSPRDAAGEAGPSQGGKGLTFGSEPRDSAGSSSSADQTAALVQPSCSIVPSCGDPAEPVSSSDCLASMRASAASMQAWPSRSSGADVESVLCEAISTAERTAVLLSECRHMGSMPGTAASLQDAAAAAVSTQAWSRRSSGTEVERVLYDVISSAQVCLLLLWHKGPRPLDCCVRA